MHETTSSAEPKESRSAPNQKIHYILTILVILCLVFMLGVRVGSLKNVYEWLAENAERNEEYRLAQIEKERRARCMAAIPEGAENKQYCGDGSAMFTLPADGKRRRFLLYCFKIGETPWVVEIGKEDVKTEK